MFNFKNWFLCQFSSNAWLFLAGALSIPQKLENAKMNLQISIQGGVKLKKRERVVFHRQNRSQNFRFYKCYDICFHNFCDKHPLMGKNASKVWKKYSSNISPLFLDAEGSQISEIWLYFHFLLLLHLIQAQREPFSFIWNIWMRKKWWTRLKFPSEIFGCGENERQSSEILNDIAPIALAA